MTRISVLLIFATLIVVVLNFKNGQSLKVGQGYFNLKNYEEKYHQEQTLIAELQAPKEEVEAVVAEVVEEAGPVLQLTTDSQLRGQKLFAKCTTCHGKNADGKKSQKAPKIAGQYDWYIADKIKQMQKGIWNNKVMMPYIKNLSDQDIKDLAAYLSAYNW